MREFDGVMVEGTSWLSEVVPAGRDSSARSRVCVYAMLVPSRGGSMGPCVRPWR